MPSHPKRHHYLPESYLKRFTRQKALWVYDVETKQLRPQTPHDTGAIGYFNALEDKDGNRSFVIEEALSEIEGATVQVMQRIEAREKLSDEDRHTLAHFVALQMLRGPDCCGPLLRSSVTWHAYGFPSYSSINRPVLFFGSVT